jgi:hypothetical protein
MITIVTMFLDFVQYLAGYRNVNSLLREMEDEEQTEANYKYESATYRLRKWCFRGNLFTLTLTVLCLLYVLGYWLFSSYAAPMTLEWSV